MVPAQVPNLDRLNELAGKVDAAAKEEYRAELERLRAQFAEWQASADVELQDRSRQLSEIRDALHDEIQKRRQTERAAEQRFQGIVETSLEAIALLDASGTILYNSPAVRNITGFTPESLVGKGMFELMYPEHIAENERLFRQLLQDPSSTATTECLYRHVDGGWRWLEAVAINALAAPAIRAIVVHFRDITEKKQAEEALRQANEQLEQRVRERTLELEASASRIQAILNTAVDAIITMDPDGTIRTFNRAAEKMFGYLSAEMIGRNLRKLRQVVHRGEGSVSPGEGELADLGPDIGSGLEAVGVRENGERFPMELIISESHLGKQRWFTGFLRDITERKQGEESLRRAKDAAEAANRAKSEFLANMSHEIRTPMNGILGMAELILETDLSAVQHEFVSAIQSSGHALLTVINDILDFSKIEAGKLEFDNIEFSLRETLGDAVKSLALKAHEKNLELVYEVEPDVIDDLVGDPYRLRQVLVNLVGNAVKFTEKGEVAVAVGLQNADGRLKIEERDGETGPTSTPANLQSAICHLHFSVTDTGIGISPDSLATILQPFMQADGSITRRYGGTGLGLTISSQLIERMGGRIWIESELGKGSRFHFTASFALADADAAGQPVMPPEKLNGMAVLIVDDNATNRRILTDMLENWRMNPHAVGGAREAMLALKDATERRQPFELILLDVMMQDVDGFGLAHAMRLEADFRSVPIIFLSSAHHKGDMLRCRELGRAVFLVKPVKGSELTKAISKLLRISWPKQTVRVEVSPGRQHAGVTGLSILLAEDNPINQNVAIHMLQNMGHQVTVVDNGLEAVEFTDKQSFDMVLMDVQMPGMDGYEATSKIRMRERHTGRHMPIIAITAHAMKGVQEDCLAAGMDGYITKPMRAKDLYHAIASVTALVSPLKVDPAAEMADAEVFDRRALLERLSQRHDLVRKMVGLFRSERPRMMASLKEALASGNAQVLASAAHAMKGAIGNLGALQAYAEVREIEELARRNQLPEAAAVLTKLERDIGRFQDALENLGNEMKP